MLISNETALNILLANNNKVLNDVLKETDNKTLNNLLKQDKGQLSTIDAGKVLKEVFDNIKDGTKSNSSLENMLKNSNLFKDLGSVSTNISNLLDSVKDDENLQKFKPLLENFAKNLKDIDANSLKEQLKNSGIFLENKLTQNSNLSTKIENILQNISNLLKNIDTPQAKEINNLINNIIKNVSNPTFVSSGDLQTSLKNLTTALQNLNNALNNPQTQSLSNLVNELKTVLNQGTIVESKIENTPTQNQTPQLQTKTVENPIVNLANNQVQNSTSSQATNQLQNPSILETKNSINLQVKELLVQIKNDIIQNPTSVQNKNILPIIDNLLKINDFFSKPEVAIQNNQQPSQNISNLTNNLQNINLSTFSNNFTTNLSPLLNALKDSLQSQNPQNSQIQEHINTLIKKVEIVIQEQINNPTQNLKTNIKLEDDFKSVLLQMQDELSTKTDVKSQDALRTINNLITQVDYHQLTSIVSNSNYVYIPFFWEMLEDGTIEMKQKDEEKFFCQIKLTLKDFGKVDLMLSLYDENKLDMTIYAQREHFKIALRDNMQQLKIALNNVELIPINIKLLDMKDEEIKEEKPSNIYQQNYYNSESFGSKVDIKA
ncbi:flagellar hook-length control protein FliK [Aliarcobacter vitoriensis]|uniref:Flagellar hook-length control protein FliK n=1 Tax=Aliarcobacter vitoriensis TaxID=2011099 RepID=A0A366MVA3_9BACT|nr:flagellar hook-length control protein FliK [Aliarcobacter vitoriensis]RBQ29419.1 flagellar hook-length control protein FliK [Aliarcobacter vitoriensis]